MRRYLNFAIVTAAVFLILLTWLAPHILLWWGTPPFELPYACNQAITWSAHRLIQSQLCAIVLGALVGLGLCFGWSRRHAKPPAAPKS